jgi:hypothetical protein
MSNFVASAPYFWPYHFLSYTTSSSGNTTVEVQAYTSVTLLVEGIDIWPAIYPSVGFINIGTTPSVNQGNSNLIFGAYFTNTSQGPFSWRGSIALTGHPSSIVLAWNNQYNVSIWGRRIADFQLQ